MNSIAFDSFKLNILQMYTRKQVSRYSVTILNYNLKEVLIFGNHSLFQEL